ncbi:MAG TPA: DUF2029 domain-containing protein [Candidatus Avipropionibacterium avicola]|uniref:DUF2029 domain-containing protein n=1 Tax=Candidatus Avipropionibacterium avicola TaxID=2840701 RepID=A0A9D1KMA1_9ACTN|nr:DUF2029 domain-containing protein [Candidatus Avipropionibacterium avicola]
MTQRTPLRVRRLTRWLVEFLPAWLVALLILPWVIRNGTAIPWAPQTTDLEVYVWAVRDLLAGKDIYQTQTPLGLWFIYPPIAAVLMIPLVVGPYVLWQLIWTGLLIAAQNSVLVRLRVPRGWALAVVSACVVLAMEPIRTTLGYGQVNTMLMFLVIADLLPDRVGADGKVRRRFIPQGTLIGLAAAIKLTPLVFLVFLLVLGRRRAFVVGTLTFVVLTVVGALLMWEGTATFFGGLLGGDTKTSGPQYVGNQSLVGVTTRLLGPTPGATVLGLGIAAVVGLLILLVGLHWWQRGEKGFAVALGGIATCLASPLSWTHHWVWVLPLGVAAALSTKLPAATRVLAGLLTLWVSLCLPLSVLPYGEGAVDHYNAGQQVVANLGPLLAVVLVVQLAVGVLRERNTRAS